MSLSQIIQESFNADPTMDEAVTFLTESTLPLLKAGEADLNVILESFDTEPYKITERFTKGSGRIGYNFTDKAGEDFQILFIKDNSYGQNVTRVRFGKRRGNVFVDKIDRFADPRAVIATYLNVFSEFLTTAEGITQRGFVMDISGAAAARAVPILRKIINATLRSKVSVVKQEFDTEPPRRNIWITKGTLAASAVFNGKACQGAPWMSSNDVQVGSDEAPKPKADATTKSGVDNAGVKKAKFNPMDTAQIVVNEITPALKKVWPTASVTISNTQPLKVVSFQVFTDGQVQRTFAFAHKQLQDGVNVKDFTKHIIDTVKAYQKNVSELQAKKQAELEQAANLKKDPAFYLKQQQSTIEGKLNLELKGYNFKLKFGGSGGLVEIGVYGDNGNQRAFSQTMSASETKETDAEVNDITNLLIKGLKNLGFDGKNPGIYVNQTVTVLNVKRYDTNAKSDTIEGVVSGKTDRFVSVRVGSGSFNVDYADIKVGSTGISRTKTQTQTGSGKVAQKKSPVIDQLVDYGFKDVKEIITGRYKATTPEGVYIFEIVPEGMKVLSVSSPDGVHTDNVPSGGWGYDVLKQLSQKGTFWLGNANLDKGDINTAIVKELRDSWVKGDETLRNLGFKVGLFSLDRSSEFDKSRVQFKREYVSPDGQVYKFSMIGVWKPTDSDVEVNAGFEKFGSGTFSGLRDTARVSGPTNTSQPFVRIAKDLFDGFTTELNKIPPTTAPKAIKVGQKILYSFFDADRNTKKFTGTVLFVKGNKIGVQSDVGHDVELDLSKDKIYKSV